MNLARAERRSDAADLAVSVEHLTVGHPDADPPRILLDDISFDLPRNSVLGLVGQSGAGKTLVCNAVLNLVSPPLQILDGRVRFGERDLLMLSDRELRSIRGRRIGLISSEARRRLHPMLPIGRQVENVWRAHFGERKDDGRARVMDVLRKVGLPGAEMRYRSFPHELSGGMAQRVLIAMALICEPEVIVADNPTFGLDVTIQLQILELLESLIGESGVSVIVATHDLGIVARLCDQVAVLDEGKLIESGPIQRVLTSPHAPFTQQLVQAARRGTRREEAARSHGGGRGW